MSDSFSAPVTKEQLKGLIVKLESTLKNVKTDLEAPSIDTIVLHNLADEFEGLATEFRYVVENSIEAYVMAKNAGVIR